MASAQDVKQYLAYWFQLGKKVCIRNGQETLQPSTVLSGNRYSPEFEECWQQLQTNNAGDCYLEGTHQTIAEMLTHRWEISACARCDMPIPIQKAGIADTVCPCSDLPTWPNTELPQPRLPVDGQTRLSSIRDRLLKLGDA